VRVHRGVHLLAFCLALSFCGCKQEGPVHTGEASSTTRKVAEEGHIYGYPLVLTDVTRTKLTNVLYPQGPGAAPINQFGHIKTFPDATFTDVVSPDGDTLYSQSWLNLEKEPIVLSVPDMHGGY
jgi:hypothetical protein